VRTTHSEYVSHMYLLLIPVAVRLRRRSAAARLLVSRVPIPLRAWMLVSCVSCVSSGLCDELITRWGESYWVCVCVCVFLQMSPVRGPRPNLGRCVTEKENVCLFWDLRFPDFYWAWIPSLYSITFSRAWTLKMGPMRVERVESRVIIGFELFRSRCT